MNSLLVCGECGCSMVSHHVARRWIHYRCETRYLPYRGGSQACAQTHMIAEQMVQDWLDARLRQAIDMGLIEALFSKDGLDLAGQIKTLAGQISRLETRIRRALDRQLDVETTDALYAIYQQEIVQASAELNAHKATFDDLSRRTLVSGQETRERQQSFAELQAVNLDAFWQLEPREINRFLHRLMGHSRLVILDGQIVGMTDAPSLHGGRRPPSTK